MNISSIFQKNVNRIYDNFAKNPGKFLLCTGTLGWLLSSLGQLSALAVDKKIPKEQKKFLIPQEIGDAAFNIASFMIFTHSITELGEGLAKKGRIITPKVKKILTDLGHEAKIGKKGFNIEDLPEIKELNAKFKPALKEAYHPFADGVSFVSSTIGSIISCNLITPILRNKFAASRQKQSIAEDKRLEAMHPASPVLPAQNRLSMENYKSKLINRPQVTTGGSMRV